GRAAHGRPRGGQETAGAKGNNPPALPPRTRASSAAGRNLSTMESAGLPTRPTGSGKVRNPACGLVDNTARLRILTSSQFPPRPDIITDLLRADIFKNLQHPLSWRKGGTDKEIDSLENGRGDLFSPRDRGLRADAAGTPRAYLRVVRSPNL